MRTEIVKKMESHLKEVKMHIMAKKCRIPYATLYRMFHERTGNIEAWERLNKYLDKQNGK